MIKQCKKCGEWLEGENFYTHPQTIDGYRNICINCSKEQSAKRQREKWIRKTVIIDRNYLLSRRKELGLTQREVASLCNMSIDTYRRIERGYKGYYRTTSYENWNKILEVIGEE